MTETKKMKIALFRFGVIFPLLTELAHGESTRIVDEIVSREHDIPHSTKTSITRSTVYEWLRSYRAAGNSIDALKPKDRKDKGVCRVLDQGTMEDLGKLREAHPDAPLTTVVDLAVKEGVLKAGDEGHMSSLYRKFSGWTPEGGQDGQDMRRFEAESCNDTWMCDAMVGPRVSVMGEDGRPKVVQARCFAFIDDKSRRIMHAAFYPNEKADSLLDCMWKAFNKNGLPRRIFTDNGSAMKDQRLALGLADLEVQLSFSKPYRPQGKAKIERFWRTLRMDFVCVLPEGPLDLGELNRQLGAFVKLYNCRYHSGIGMSPDERYAQDLGAVRIAPMDLPLHFRRREERKVSAARTVTVDNRLLQVPMGYSGKKVELRFMTLDGRIDVYHEGNLVGTAEPVDLVANSLAHRKGVPHDAAK